VLTAVLWAGVLVAVPLVVVRWVDNSIGMVAVLQSMTPVVALGVSGLLLVAVVARRWRVSIVAGALFAICAALTLPSALGHTVTPGRGDLVVMSANLQYGAADVGALMMAARQHRVDVLVLIEITPDAVERLRIAGLDSFLPVSVGQPRHDAGGTIIRSRMSMSMLDPGLAHSPHAFNQPAVSIHGPDGDVVLRAVHSLPPSPSGAADWRSGLADLQMWRERQQDTQPIVMAGDFNASESHPGFRKVAATMTDAHRSAGQGWVRTWPMGRRVPPFIQLDHVLVRGLTVVDAGTVTIPHTDHRAIWTRLSRHRP
jgi:endonuclease/exonuclease/phosphatase (EEP) superfamily protein YafD